MKNPMIGHREFDKIVTEDVYPAILKAFGSIAKENAPETDALIITAAKHLGASLSDFCTECGITFTKSMEYDPEGYRACSEYADEMLSRLTVREQKKAVVQ
jgi:hypothetical protein